jgi:serine/threonine-protein kinase
VKTEPDAAVIDPGAHPFGPGQLLCGRYTVERRLGQGTGWVYAALGTDGERVAVRVLKPELAKDKRRELETLGRIHAAAPCTNVVRPKEADILVESGLSLIVLEHVSGPTLHEVMVKERRLDPEEARKLARGLAHGISRLHAVGGTHRDLRPKKVRLRDGVVPVILDPGLAKESMTTPLYAAPEQLGGGEVGPACDVYAFGLILFEMLTGTVPHAGSTAKETHEARLSQRVPDPRALRRPLPSALAVLSMQCLDPEPARRPTAEQIVATLDAPGSTARKVSPAASSGPSLPVDRPHGYSPLAASVLIEPPRRARSSVRLAVVGVVAAMVVALAILLARPWTRRQAVVAPIPSSSVTSQRPAPAP